MHDKKTVSFFRFIKLFALLLLWSAGIIFFYQKRLGYHRAEFCYLGKQLSAATAEVVRLQSELNDCTRQLENCRRELSESGAKLEGIQRELSAARHEAAGDLCRIREIKDAGCRIRERIETLEKYYDITCGI